MTSELMSAIPTGTVSSLWRFPVKSMLGERIARATVTPYGFLGDRGYALVDGKTDAVVSAVNTRDYPNLFRFKARYLTEPSPDNPLPAVEIELPDGAVVSSDDEGVDSILSEHMGRSVRLSRSAPEQPFMDANPVSVLTTSTLSTMSQFQPESVYDERRFRMNLIVETMRDGFPENEWLGSTLHVGRSVQLAIIRPDERCVMTTLAQEDLPNDPAILRGLVRHNRIKVSETRKAPCAGVYAQVLGTGDVRAGDSVGLG